MAHAHATESRKTEGVHVAATKVSPAIEEPVKRTVTKAPAKKAAPKTANGSAPAKRAAKAPAKKAAKAAGPAGRGKKTGADGDDVVATDVVETGDDLEAEPGEDLEADADIELEDLEVEADDTAEEGAAPADGKAAKDGAGDDDIAEPSEKDKASGDFVWDEEESEALRQARKDAELTASADSVRAYLKQIGKVALLNAEEEVELAKRIEAGLYATQRMPRGRRGRARSSTTAAAARPAAGSAATASAPRTTCSRRTSASSSRWPSATPAAAWRSST